MTKKKSLFGLPEKVQHCKKCLLTNQKPFSINETKNSKNSSKEGLQFNKDGVCLACQYSESKNNSIKITKLAQGLPIGGEIEQLDDGTLFSAFKNRVPVTSD